MACRADCTPATRPSNDDDDDALPGERTDVSNLMICATAVGEKSPSTANIEKTVTGKAALEKALACIVPPSSEGR